MHKSSKRRVDRVVGRSRNRSARDRITEAAVDLFSTRGYAATTLQEIARAAHVHEQSIYQVFGSKIAVLTAAFDLVRAGGEDPSMSPAEWPWARALIADPDPASQLRRYAAHLRNIAPGAGPLVAELRNAARSAPELAAFLEHSQAGGYLGPSGIVALIAEKGALRRDLSQARAADTMFAVASFEGYERLVQDRRWSPAEYERWLGDLLCELLLEPTEMRPRSAGRPRPGS